MKRISPPYIRARIIHADEIRFRTPPRHHLNVYPMAIRSAPGSRNIHTILFQTLWVRLGVQFSREPPGHLGSSRVSPRCHAMTPAGPDERSWPLGNSTRSNVDELFLARQVQPCSSKERHKNVIQMPPSWINRTKMPSHRWLSRDFGLWTLRKNRRSSPRSTKPRQTTRQQLPRLPSKSRRKTSTSSIFPQRSKPKIA